MELAIINGTYRDTSKPTSTQTTTPSVTRKSGVGTVGPRAAPETRLECSAFTLFLFIACHIYFWLMLVGACMNSYTPGYYFFHHGWFKCLLICIVTVVCH